MPLWLLAVIALALALIFGDMPPRHSMYVSPEKAAALKYNTWPEWTKIEKPAKRIRMLWIIHDYVPFVNAGSEICAHTINTLLMKKPYKYDIWVACPGYPNKTYEGIRCFDLYDNVTLEKVLKFTHILHSHSYVYRKQCQYISRVMGIPFVEWVHTDNYVRSIDPAHWVDPRIKDRQWTVFNSESLKETAPKLPDATTKIVLPIVDYRNYRIQNNERKPLYVTLSNVNENKGGPLLIQLAQALPELDFVGIIGGYRKQVTRTDLPNLHYIPHTTQIKDVYKQTWVQIMPSKEETWGRTAVEAMSSGIPVVVSPTPGLKECCGTAAIYCDRSNLDAWVSTLRKLKEDKEYYNVRSAKSMERARALDPKPEIEALERWLNNEVLKSKVSGRPLTLTEKNLLFR